MKRLVIALTEVMVLIVVGEAEGAAQLVEDIRSGPLRARSQITWTLLLAWREGVVPVAVEFVTFQA